MLYDIFTFLLSLMLVKMACTLHVLLNIAPNDKVKPIESTQQRACHNRVDDNRKMGNEESSQKKGQYTISCLNNQAK